MNADAKKKLQIKTLTGFFIFMGLIAMMALRQISIYVFDVFFIAISSMATFEVAHCLNKKLKGTYKFVSLVYPILLYAVFLTSFLLNLSWWWILIFQIWLLFITFLVLTIICFAKKQKMSRVWWTVFSFFYPAYLLSFFYFVNHGAMFFGTGVDVGLLGIILVLGISVITDSMAMWSGMLLKGPKIWVKASPNKTISGCCGGLIFGILASMCIYFIFNAFAGFHTLFVNNNIKFWHFLIVGFVGSFLTQLGDLMESFFKRKVGVKDTGNFFPGHGGFLDRVDGWCFNVVGIYFSMLILFA